jgi:hypothetical protein
MNRFSSQLVFCSPQKILRRTVVEQNKKKIISNLINLDNQLVETSNTQFLDGILSTEIISLKQILSDDELLKISENFQYIDIQNDTINEKFIPSENPLILDFGTNEVNEINPILSKIAGSLANFTIFEIIAACVYFPSIILGKPALLDENPKTDLILWENIDLVNKKITNLSKLINLSNFVNS